LLKKISIPNRITHEIIMINRTVYAFHKEISFIGK
jgi:hypothetical protein